MSRDDAIRATRQQMRERDYEAEAERLRLDVANVPRRQRDATMAKIPDAAPYKQKLIRWHDLFLESIRDGQPFYGLYLYGPVSTGKSAIAAGILKWATRIGLSGFWVNYREIFDLSKDDPYWHPRIDEGAYSYAQRCQVLVIDDFLQVSLGNRYDDLLIQKFEEVYRLRSAAGLVTVLAGNRTLEDLSEIGLGHVADLIEESAYPLEINTFNYRKAIGKKKPQL